MADPGATAFDWKGDAGDKFAAANPTTAEGMDEETLSYYDKSCTDLFKVALDDMTTHGLDQDRHNLQVLDVGCSSGGKLAVLESLGFKGKNLYGVDMSPKAVQLLAKSHPDYHVQEVSGFQYTVFGGINFDLVYHSAVFCQISPEQYGDFFRAVKELRPKFYMFLEGISPDGSKKVKLSEAHGHHHGGHGSHGDHGGRGHHGNHGDHGGQEFKTTKSFDNMEEGLHYADNLEAVLEKEWPEARQIGRQKINFQDEVKEMFRTLGMQYSLAAVYKIE